MKPGKEQLLREMEAYFGADQRRIEHARRVSTYAEQLFQAEGGDYPVIITAAILHDIGIHQAERKYGSPAGHYQEQEGPPIARKILEKLGMDEALISEVCQIIAHHHHPHSINTINFKILCDADMLVNLAEEVDISNRNKLARVIERAFLTSGGRELAKKLYLENQDALTKGGGYGSGKSA
jgi:HD superfamily phosphodiesterase